MTISDENLNVSTGNYNQQKLPRAVSSCEMSMASQTPDVIVMNFTKTNFHTLKVSPLI